MSVVLYDKLAVWAQSKSKIAALHIHGARARGVHRPDSALELALEFTECGDELAELHVCATGWKQELSLLCGLEAVALELRSNKEVVKLPIITVYRRQTS